MKFLKTILDFYINTSIHVAVAVFSLVQITKLQLNISTNSNLDFFIFFGTILGYNFLKYFEVFWNRVFTFKKNYSIIIVGFLAFLGMIFYFLKLENTIQFEFVKIGFLILIYSFIRKFGFVKMAFVAFCITYITVYVIEINYHYIYLFQRFLIIFSLLIPLEICDLKSDSKTIKTLPIIIGINKFKILGYCFLLVFCFLQFAFYNLLFAFLVVFAIFLSKENCSKYYTSFWVEGLPIAWWFLLFFTK